jgi:hypothetical protein
MLKMTLQKSTQLAGKPLYTNFDSYFSHVLQKQELKNIMDLKRWTADFNKDCNYYKKAQVLCITEAELSALVERLKGILTKCECDITKLEAPEDKLYINHFKKNCYRQTIHERSQLQWLKNKAFPDLGKPAIPMCLDENGDIVKQKPRSTKVGGSSKSFDAFSPSLNTFFMLKFTTGEGGSQDNQLREMVQFIRLVRLYISKHGKNETRFSIILDGEYYRRKSRIEDMKQITIDFGIEKELWIGSCNEIAS